MDIKMAAIAHESGHLIVITPRAVGNAPERNLIRRRIKAIFYENQLYTKDRVWLFFIKKEALSLKFSELSALVLDTVLPRLQ